MDREGLSETFILNHRGTQRITEGKAYLQTGPSLQEGYRKSSLVVKQQGMKYLVTSPTINPKVPVESQYLASFQFVCQVNKASIG
jgi:hypothetical protein